MQAAYLGIDVGGTASRWALVDAQGKVLGRGAAGGATAHVFNPVERNKLDAVLQAIAADAGQVAPITAARLGLTGFGDAVETELKTLAAARLGLATDDVAVTNDLDLAFHATFQLGAGHLVSAGTGSIGLHIDAAGNTLRVGGRGLLIDDGGSGTWIALTALDQLYRRIDETGGAAEAGVLADKLFAAMGGDDWDITKQYIYGSDRGRIGGLAQAVASAADEGDPLALKVLSDAAGELARLAKALIGRGGALPVAFIGGVIRLHPSIQSALIAALPGVDISFPQIDPALHAANAARLAATQRTTP
ncbi:BadF/BadG/BcrA/BcrD ATPase family protein [Devosia sp. 2618]|uniref:N-acetylglucosamine kinase n=1 Tax=Devosia sp. 2618 TaxID=3156454 RepID=UPI003395009E